MTTVSRDIGETRDYILLGKSILLLRVCLLFIVGRGERGEGGERRIFVEKTGNLRDDPPPPPLEIFHVLFFFFNPPILTVGFFMIPPPMWSRNYFC